MSGRNERPPARPRRDHFYRIVEIDRRDGPPDDAVEIAWPGRTAPPPAPPAPPAPDAEAWPLRSPPRQSLSPPRGHAARHLGETATGALVVALFDVPPERIEAAVRLIERQLPEPGGLCPVFLTDTADTRAIRHAGFVHEYFPRGVYGAPHQAPLFEARFRMLWRKWNGRRLVDLGARGHLAERLTDLDRYLGPIAPGGGAFDPRLPRPEPPPAPVRDVAALKADHALSGMADEADSFVLYRILGNDLPPRHEAGQTLANLRFILDHEPDLPHCEKRFVVNRIVDPEAEAAVLALLRERGQSFLHLPFVLEDYARTGWDLESFFDGEAFFLRGRAEAMTPYDRARAEAHLRRHRNNYLVNNNGARNAALRDGKTRAKWVLPWDGNCFLTAAAWEEIVTAILAEPWLKYVTVPMARSLDNADLLDPSRRPEADGEPQIVFRRDSAEEFDEARAYGRRPKVELLWRLGVPGVWDGYRDDVWDLPRPALSPEAAACGEAGWVARLYSGQGGLEGERSLDLRSRGEARIDAVNRVLDRLDVAAMERVFAPDRLIFYDEDAVAALRDAPEGSAGATLRERLLLEADLALARGPYAVTDKPAPPPGGDRHDYHHPAPYYWPNPHTPDGLPYLRRDGERVPGTRLYEPESDRYDRTRLQRMFDDTTLLALGWLLRGDDRLAAHAARLVRTWFLDAETRMSPHLTFAQTRSQSAADTGAASGLIEFKDLYYFLDAVRILERAGALSQAEQAAFRDWLRAYLDWLETSPQGRQERLARNNHGTCYDLQTGAIAAFLGDAERLGRIFLTSRERIFEQFSDDGSQPEEMSRTLTAHYCCFNLQAWVNLATLAEACGHDLWSFEGKGGRGLAQAFAWLLPRMGEAEWPFEQIEPFDPERFLPLYVAARDRVGAAGLRQRVEALALRPMYFAHDGIRPFWMLARRPTLRPQVATWSRLARKMERFERSAADLLHVPAPEFQDAPDVLGERLRQGFVETAGGRLAEILADDHAPASWRAAAARALTRQSFETGAFEAARAHAAALHSHLAASGAPAQLVAASAGQAALIDAFCADGLGQRDVARALLEARRADGRDLTAIDLALAHCDRDRPEAQIARLNGICRDVGLSDFFAPPGAGSALETAPAPPPGPLARTGAGEATVTVILGADAQGADIEPALATITAQTWSALDIFLVVRAGEADGARLAGMAGRDPRIRILSLPRGASDLAVLREALSQSTGRYVALASTAHRAHPERIALQIRPLLDGEGRASLCAGLRVASDLAFVPVWEPGFGLVAPDPQSLLVEREALREALDRHAPGPEAGSAESLHGDMADWLADAGHRPETVLPDLPLTLTLLPEPHAAAETHHDIVYVADFSTGGLALNAILARIEGELREGRWVGLVHWPRYPGTDGGGLDAAVRDLLRDATVTRADAGDSVLTPRLVLANPYVLTHAFAGLPRIRTERLEVLGGPELHAPEYRTPLPRHLPTRAQIEAVFGVPPVWTPF
jgi:hypothetical protein